MVDSVRNSNRGKRVRVANEHIVDGQVVDVDDEIVE
jgi:hypothetical protein